MQQGKGLGQLTLPEGCGGVLEGPGPVLVLKEGLDLEGEEGGRVCQEVGLVTQRSARACHVGELRERGSVSLGAGV